jgi:hypothetical protein
MGKDARRPFPPNEHRSKGVLDLIHSDVCGPMSVESVSLQIFCSIYRWLLQEDLDILPEG